MNAPWSLVVFVDIFGSIMMLLISCCCATYSWGLIKKKPEDSFQNYIFLFTLAILFFAVSRSFGHLVKQLLLMNDMAIIWKQISPFSGAINSTAFVVIFALSLFLNRFEKVYSELENYKNNLEEMITVRTEELEKSKNTLENILNNSNPINITGVNFDLLQANEAYYSLWPQVSGKEEVVKCYESRPGAYCHTDECPLKLIIEGSEEVVQEVTKDFEGETKVFITTSRPFRDVDSKLIGMVESFQDITLRKEAERSLIKIGQMKSEIISTTAHELNTPLSTILGYAEILRRPDEYRGFTEKQKHDFINEIYDNGEALSRIIDDLLDISRIENGKPIPLLLEENDLIEILRKKVKNYTTHNEGYTFHLELPQNPKISKFKFDRHRINQVLENLLSNAVKYSHEGKEITITGTEKKEGWEVKIKDTGIGMKPKDLDLIFEKFYRADTSNTAPRGLGLGMSVVKQIIEAHGGNIRVDSVEGKGTTVVFNLPFMSNRKQELEKI